MSGFVNQGENMIELNSSLRGMARLLTPKPCTASRQAEPPSP
jgi:hypothetical protein